VRPPFGLLQGLSAVIFTGFFAVILLRRGVFILALLGFLFNFVLNRLCFEPVVWVIARAKSAAGSHFDCV